MSEHVLLYLETSSQSSKRFAQTAFILSEIYFIGLLAITTLNMAIIRGLGLGKR